MGTIKRVGKRKIRVFESEKVEPKKKVEIPKKKEGAKDVDKNKGED